jgi:steroid 5-alpha reductase family enzyme
VADIGAWSAGEENSMGREYWWGIFSASAKQRETVDAVWGGGMCITSMRPMKPSFGWNAAEEGIALSGVYMR